ncbi:MAG: hypothetical protein WCT39_04785 [Candidatus Margulisiibacteriota bacterium]
MKKKAKAKLKSLKVALAAPGSGAIKKLKCGVTPASAQASSHTHSPDIQNAIAQRMRA